MKKSRILAVLLLMSLMFGGLVVRLFFLSKDDGQAKEAAGTHGSYTLKIAAPRGLIYDTKLRPLVNESSRPIAVVCPQSDIEEQYSTLAPYVSDKSTLLTRLQQGKPFFVAVSSGSITADGVSIVSTPVRYSDTAVAPHVIGYVNSDGDGVSGIEKAYDSLLKEAGGTITASFAVDALGRTLQGLSAEVNEEKGSGSGVVLTLDKDIQAFTQQAALKYLKSGAAVVMDVKTGDILALSSVPEFSQNDVAAAISAANSPLIDRAFSAYDLGSVFKISLCAEAIESNIPTSMTVDCTGKIDVSGRIFRCEKLSGHGVEDMEQGLSNSCNIYFITLGRLLGGDKILDMAKRLGFGSTLELAPGLKPSAGVLPTAQQMKIPAALANFSLGQGNFMATPIQVARMISAVANDGLLPQARLVKGIVGADGKMTAIYAGTEPQRVFSSAISGELQQFLINTVDVGTGMPAKPDIGGAGGKTGTAQTGWVKNGKAIDEAWFAGFYPAQNPRYAIIVVSEAGKAGGTSAGPVFKQIADHLAPYCGLR